MKEYIAYKEWWITHHAPNLIPSAYWGWTVEHAFEQHVKDMGLYKLMETLAVWSAE